MTIVAVCNVGTCIMLYNTFTEGITYPFTLVRKGSFLHQLDGQLLWLGDLLPYELPL